MADDAQAEPGDLFLKNLIALYRAEDTYGAWAGKSDDELLAPFVLTREQRREIPIIGDPDPDTIWRLELFYKAIGLTIERETGLIASPMIRMSHEGFGRIVLIAGRLVVVSRHLRDVHRFGFPSQEKLVEEGAKLVAQAVELIRKHRDVAEL